jgi:hypothetical protein
VHHVYAASLFLAHIAFVELGLALMESVARLRVLYQPAPLQLLQLQRDKLMIPSSSRQQW